MGNTESNPNPQSSEAQEIATGLNTINELSEASSSSTNTNARIRLDSSKTLADEESWWSQLENEEFILESLTTPGLTPATTTTQETSTEIEEDPSSKVDLLCPKEGKEKQENQENEENQENQENEKNKETNPLVNENEIKEENSNSKLLNNSEENVNDMKSMQRAREQSLEEYKEELRVKRLARQTAVQDLRDEINYLRQQLAREQALNKSLQGLPSNEADLPSTTTTTSTTTSIPNSSSEERRKLESEILSKEVKDLEEILPSSGKISKEDFNVEIPTDDGDDTDDVDPLSRSRHANIELANAQLALQLSQAENLSLRTELGVVQKQVGTLKEVVSCCKQMLAVKDEQCDQLKAKLKEIEASFNENEMKIMSSKLRQEYERQLENIRQLRQLYEERQRIANAEHENLQRLISIKKDELKAEQEKCKNVEECNQTLVKEVENANIELATLREECNEHKFEKKALKEEMGAVNTLFTQMVMGFNGKNNLDIDRLTAMLEENRALLNEMTTKEANCSDDATLPKLLFELVEQAAVVDKNNTSCTLTPTLNVSGDEKDQDDNTDDNDNDENCVEDDEDVVDDEDVGEGGEEGDENADEENNDGNVDVDGNVEAVDMLAVEVNDNVVAGNGNMMDVTDCVQQTATNSNNNNNELNDENVATTSTTTTSTNKLNDDNTPITTTSSSLPITTTDCSTTSSKVSSDLPTTSGSGTTSIASSATSASASASTSASTSVQIQKNPSNNKKHSKRNNNVKKNKISSQRVGSDSATATSTATATASSSSSSSASLLGASGTLGATTKTLKFNEPEVMGKVVSAQEIIGNLPKVWKVLMELLSHHKIEKVQFEENGGGEDCYKSAEALNGAKPELSVSKTYIKLKDLILEKKSLVKETNRLKTLNSHLDYRLNEQQERLGVVTRELTKTWHLVGKMQRQHRQLHTQEQILRYQLQQKRRLLSELKDELEYCRRKWAAARAKNDESQEQCNDLRREFAQRKLEDANHSAESGYSDSGPQSDDDERPNDEHEETSERKVAGKVMKNISIGAAVAKVSVPSVGKDEVDESAVAGNVNVIAKASTSHSSTRLRNNLREMFEHTRKIKRMQSSSPGRNSAAAAEALAENSKQSEDVVLRWNSAPPTCGWRSIDGADDDDEEEEQMRIVTPSCANRGAIPKVTTHNSRAKQRPVKPVEKETDDEDTSETLETAHRIQRLEEQCKSLIQKVIETSDNRERLEVQLCKFQDEIAPVQYAVPLDEFTMKKRLERMTRASSAPASGCLTPREEEYTRKRSERLERLEEESRQLIMRIKRTSDRGHYLRCSLDRFKRAPVRDESFESNTEEELPKVEEQNESQSNGQEEVAAMVVGDETDNKPEMEKSPLTAEEEEYTSRRRARLERLEEEGKQLVARLSRNVQRGETLENQLDSLHERHGEPQPSSSSALRNEVTSIEKRLEDMEQMSQNREKRLRILEAEGKQLLDRLTNTSERGTQMINRIAEREKRKETTKESEELAAAEAAASASVLLPTPNTVACSSIVGEELADSVTVTTTSTQIASQRGAIPKTKPQAELSVFARAKQTRASTEQPDKQSNGEESLEEMIKRLKDLPFPESEDSQPAKAEDKETCLEEEAHGSAEIETPAKSNENQTQN